VDGDQQPKGGTTRLSGMTGVMLMIGAFFGVLVLIGVFAMLLTGEAGP